MKEDIKIPKRYVTYDYSIFKYIDANRDVTHIKRLKKSIETVDLTMHYPILVNNNHEIVDGQHRFEVCKQLGKPIYYEFIEVQDYMTAMQKINTSSRMWRQEDYLNLYSKLGNEVYIRFEEFMREYGFNISNAILLFSNSKTNSSDFKSGKLQDHTFDTLKAVNFLLRTKDILPRDLWGYRAFVAALIRVVKTLDDRKIKKLEKKIIAIPKFSRAEDYVSAMKNLVR